MGTPEKSLHVQAVDKKLEVNGAYIRHPFFVHVQSIVCKVIGKHFTVSDAI